MQNIETTLKTLVGISDEGILIIFETIAQEYSQVQEDKNQTNLPNQNYNFSHLSQAHVNAIPKYYLDINFAYLSILKFDIDFNPKHIEKSEQYSN